MTALEWPDKISKVKCFLEDDKYRVIGTSMGEFGGSIFFWDKKTPYAYFLKCTEPLMVDYHNGYYYLTEQYWEASYGHTRILKIKDPTRLIKVLKTQLPRRQSEIDSIVRSQGAYVESLEREIVLLDTSNVSAAVFYPYKDKNYLVYSARGDKSFELDTIFLGIIEKGVLIPLDTLLNESISTEMFEPTRIVNGVYTYRYSRQAWNGAEVKIIDMKGHVFMKGDTIVIAYGNIDRRRSDHALLDDRLSIVGDFNGDKARDTIRESYISTLTNKETPKRIDSENYGRMVSLLMKRQPLTRLFSSIAGVDTFIVTNQNQQMGVYGLSNLGDLNDDKTDEFGYIVDWADYSNLNTYRIMTLRDNKVETLFTFPINEMVSFDPDELIDGQHLLKKIGPKAIRYRFYSDSTTIETGTHRF
ncbi:MAG TPA: hypothetical protein VIU12_00020 [Chryseolinea sp.]